MTLPTDWEKQLETAICQGAWRLTCEGGGLRTYCTEHALENGRWLVVCAKHTPVELVVGVSVGQYSVAAYYMEGRPHKDPEKRPPFRATGCVQPSVALASLAAQRCAALERRP